MYCSLVCVNGTLFAYVMPKFGIFFFFSNVFHMMNDHRKLARAKEKESWPTYKNSLFVSNF